VDTLQLPQQSRAARATRLSHHKHWSWFWFRKAFYYTTESWDV